jgi:UDP-3-O-acyl-N-acetylglucosamine deacetylase
MEIVGRVRAYRAGHKLNAELVRALLADQQEPIPQRSDEFDANTSGQRSTDESLLVGRATGGSWRRSA